MKHLIFISFLFISCLNVFSQSQNADSIAVLQAERNCMKAIIAGDSTAIKNAFADNYKEFDEDDVTNRDYLLSTYTKLLTKVAANDLNMNATLLGNTAVVHGVWEIKWQNEKPVYFQMTDVFIKNDDTWQLAVSQQYRTPVWRVRKNLDDSEFKATKIADCKTELGMKSLNSNMPALLRIKNNTAQTIIVHWINYSGQRDTSADQIHEIAPGKSFDARTFLTHPFIVTGLNNTCYGIYEAETEPSIAVIKD